MKKILLLLLFISLAFSDVFALSLIKGPPNVVDNKTIINMAPRNPGTTGQTTPPPQPDVKDTYGVYESRWNFDLFLMEAIFPNQPASRQFLSNITGLGVTYKFSEAAHAWGKWTRVEFEGVNLTTTDIVYDEETGEDTGETVKNKHSTIWKHEHWLGGFGLRWDLGDAQQLVINLGTGVSEVSEGNNYGKLNLDTPVVADIKYLWVSDNISYGLNLTILEVESKEKDFAEYHKGGYVAIGLTIGFGIKGFN